MSLLKYLVMSNEGYRSALEAIQGRKPSNNEIRYLKSEIEEYCFYKVSGIEVSFPKRTALTRKEDNLSFILIELPKDEGNLEVALQTIEKYAPIKVIRESRQTA